MARSQNGWYASPTMPTRRLIIDGVEFVGGIADNDDVDTVLRYCMTQYHQRVEALYNPGCWGGYYRANRNDPNSLSNHASRTALDVNAPKHPNGVATSLTFTAAQIAVCRAIVREVDSVVRWGGDYRTTPDAMHWEINADPARVRGVAVKLRAAAAAAAKPTKPAKPGRAEVVDQRRRLTRLAQALTPGRLRERVKAARNRLPKGKGKAS